MNAAIVRTLAASRPIAGDGGFTLLPSGRDAWPSGMANTAEYLHPGQMHATKEPTIITTILGSCVSVCLFDADRRIGGANHYLLPNESPDHPGGSRYGPAAIRQLIARVEHLGAVRERMTARIIGGANVIAAFQKPGQHLGIKNAIVARQTLRDEGISIVVEHVGGERGRKVMFSVVDGSTWVQWI
jgi:chemotaxis protein CheD